MRYPNRLSPGPQHSGAAGPSVPVQATGVPSARISVLKEGQTRIAPHPVFFRASVTGFFVADAPDDTAYDPARHTLRYEWSFGNPGAASDKVENLPAAHNDLDRAYGKDVAHVFARPGRFTVSCRVTDAEGRTAEAHHDLVVEDPDRALAGTATVILDPAFREDAADTHDTGGDGPYTGAVHVATWEAAMEALGESEGQARILFPRGTELTLPATPLRDWEQRFLLLGAWGTGPRPVIRFEGDGGLDVAWRFGGDVTLQGLDFRGGWDARTETGQAGVALSSSQRHGRTILVDDCLFSGWSMALHMRTANEPDPAMSVIHNCAIGNWRDYGVFLGNNGQAFCACIGTVIAQDPLAMMGGGDKQVLANDHGPLRITEAGYFYMAACDLFSRNGWSRVEGVPADQPCLRWNTARAPGTHAQIERCAFEGGMTCLSTSRFNNSSTPDLDNLVLEKCLVVGTARTISHGLMGTNGGVTIRNTVFIKPDAPFPTNGWRASLRFEPDEGIPPEAGAPVLFYSNTIVNLLTPPHLGNRSPETQSGIEDFEIFHDENNILHAPNLGRPEAGLVGTDLATVAGVWTSRYLGVIYNSHRGEPGQDRLLTRFATGPGSVSDWVPRRGSALAGSAVGLSAIDDFHGVLRPDPPSPGALEPA
jgi:hypothetical protein